MEEKKELLETLIKITKESIRLFIQNNANKEFGDMRGIAKDYYHEEIAIIEKHCYPKKWDEIISL